MTDSFVRAAVAGRQVQMQVHGRGTMRESQAVRQFAEQALAAGAASVQVDLRHCEHLDSTFLGTLLCLRRQAAAHPQGELLLLSPSPACRRLLSQMGLLGVFQVAEAVEPPDAAWTELACDAETGGRSGHARALSGLAFKRNVVQAHQELAALPGAAGERFRQVIPALHREVDAEEKLAAARRAEGAGFEP